MSIRMLGATVVLVASLAAGVAPAAGQSDPAGSGVVRPPVFVTGDSLSHQAADDITRSLGTLGYHDVRFAVYGGTTIGWSTDRVLGDASPIVVFASGTYNAILGWTASDQQEAERAVQVLGQRRCAIWMLPAAARYPYGVPQAHVPSRDSVAGIRQAVSGSPVHLAEWDLVADALPEIHVYDGVHIDDGGQVLYGDLVAGAVRHRCEDPDPARIAPLERYASWTATTLLRRPLAADELAAWTDRLAGGHPRQAFTRTLVTTPEWAGARIDDLYLRALGRVADPGGRAHWLSLVATGAGFDVVVAHVYSSEEFVRGSGGSSRDFVTALYRRLLQREPDGPGLDTWTRALGAGTSRMAVASAFHRSPEARGSRVDDLYRQVLGREPDPGGRATWVGALARVDDLRLAARLAASGEAFRRAQEG